MGKFINKYNKILVTVFLAIIISIIFIYGFSLKKDQITKSTYHVTIAENVSPYCGKGTVASNSTYTKQIPTDALLSTELRNEQTVQKGEALAVISFPAKQAELKQVQTNITSIKEQLEEQKITTENHNQPDFKVGKDKDSADQVEMQTLRSTLIQNQQIAINNLQNRLTELQANKDELLRQSEIEVIAPFDGTYQLKQLKNGQQEIIVFSKKRVLEALVPQMNYTQVKNNAKITLKNSILAEKQDSKISFVSELPVTQKHADQPAYKFTVPVDAAFLNGQVVKFKVPQTGVQVPKSAVQKNHVYLVQPNGKAQKINVTGKPLGQKFIISDGLKKGDKIIIDPNKNLHNGLQIHERK
ncbi:MAG TPA: hypothetical protein H9803_00415 [Candidatus Ligilactobacillus excrementavium]|nr:hypothetical protein [Candidatus Ligilactobacillus excrementavium]